MNGRGFTLIELMIVIVVISIIASIAIPLLLQSRRGANEASAVQAIRTIASSQALFYNQSIRTHPVTGLAQYGSLVQLGSTSPPFIDDALESGTRGGYLFSVTTVDDGANPMFTAVAAPAVHGRTGLRTFLVDESGVVRFTIDGSVPDNTSPVLN